MNALQLGEPSWDVICDILYVISANISYYEQTSSLPKDHILPNAFHETLNIIEGMLQRNETGANPDIFYALIETVSDDRSEVSVLHLIDYMAMKISASKPEWLTSLDKFIQRFYKMPNVNIRIKAIQTLMQIMDTNRAAYEEEILERIVMSHFANVHQEANVEVRIAVGRMLVDFSAHCDTKRCLELLDMVEKVSFYF